MTPKTKKLLVVGAIIAILGGIGAIFMPDQELSTPTVATEVQPSTPKGFKFVNQSEFPALRIKQVDAKYDSWKGQYSAVLHVSNYGPEDFRMMQLKGAIYCKGKKSFEAITGGAITAKNGSEEWVLSAIIPEGKPDYLEVWVDKEASLYASRGND